MVSKNAYKLYSDAIRKIPAYKAYIDQHSSHQKKVKTYEDFKKLPTTSKKGYLHTAKHTDLFWPEALHRPTSYSSTSGSTGEPYYFPRNDELARQASFMVEEFLNNSSYGKGRVLVLVGFGMGVWIGGVFTVRQFEIASERMKAPVSILPIGYNKKEMFKALKMLSPDYDQTILVGYPPFIKEIVDEAEEENINLQKLSIRLLFAAEAFTETFRDYVCKKAGIDNPLLDTLNIYGTADIGAMAYETPLSILIRRISLEDPLLFRDLFGQYEKTPTLAQYDNRYIDFEDVDGSIYITGNGVIPLIRYSIGDNGGVRTYSQVKQLFKIYGIDLESRIKEMKIPVQRNKPFVFVYERSDMSVLVHGIIIYPEFIKEGLLHPLLTDKFTERFTMSTKNDIYHNQFLEINLELQKNQRPTEIAKKEARKIIHQTLIKKSSEYSEVSKSKSIDSLLKVTLWPKDHARYFSPGTKQKWVEKA
jgi:phenylacetate-CoA ligase